MTSLPWYRTALRWGQTNLVEIDPARYDDAWWRAQWRRTRIDGVIVNAGGIVAYYPSAIPLHHRAIAFGTSPVRILAVPPPSLSVFAGQFRFPVSASP